jgi:hypothetical protein
MENLPKDFKTFHRKFYNDSIFQKTHIKFPLKGFYMVEGCMEYNDTVYVWENDARWQIITYTKKDNLLKTDFSIADSIIKQVIYEEDGDYWEEARFKKFKDDWYLIFYSFSWE